MHLRLSTLIFRTSGSGAMTGYMPVLRFRLNFDLDLNAVLSKFNKNGTQTVPLSVKCGVERLSRK